jgi:hypothetical protein
LAINDSKVICVFRESGYDEPFWGAVSYGKLLISYRNVASDFSFAIFAIADRIFNSYIPGLLLELYLVLSGIRFFSTRFP